MSEENKKSVDDIKELVIARLDVMPSNYKLSIGDKGTFDKFELIDYVKEGDSIGQLVVNMQMNFIRALTTGKFIETLNQDG